MNRFLTRAASPPDPFGDFIQAVSSLLMWHKQREPALMADPQFLFMVYGAALGLQSVKATSVTLGGSTFGSGGNHSESVEVDGQTFVKRGFLIRYILDRPLVSGADMTRIYKAFYVGVIKGKDRANKLSKVRGTVDFQASTDLTILFEDPRFGKNPALNGSLTIRVAGTQVTLSGSAFSPA